MDWLVNDKGECEALASPIAFTDTQYPLYRFLTDLDDILAMTKDDRQRIMAICPLVRKLLICSDWIQLVAMEPDPDTGWTVHTLYDEPNFPLTVQVVSWLPQASSSIHNHGTWGIVAIISGQEQNTFWQRTGDRTFPDRIQPLSERFLTPREIIGFMPDAIHSIEAIGEEPTISFNLYGEAKYEQRFEFDLATSTAQNF
jgi:predicted metal-dependent enzyme (double-stranded beta helix superfamily)